MLVEEAAQLAFAETEAGGKRIHRGLVERPALDEHQCARHRVRRAVPSAAPRRGLGPAAQARAEAGGLRRGGGRVEDDILAPRRPRRADRPAIDAGRPDAGEEAAVEAGIARRDRPIAGVEIEIHAERLVCPGREVSPFSDIVTAGVTMHSGLDSMDPTAHKLAGANGRRVAGGVKG